MENGGCDSNRFISDIGLGVLVALSWIFPLHIDDEKPTILKTPQMFFHTRLQVDTATPKR